MSVSMDGTTVMMAAGENLPSFLLLNAASLICKLQAGYSFEEASSVNQLKKAIVPMLFIHGDADTFVPFPMLDAVFNACVSAAKEKLVVHEAAHGTAADTDPKLYWDTVTAFAGKYSSE